MKTSFILFTDEYPQYKISLNCGCLISFLVDQEKYYAVWIKNKPSISTASQQVIKHFNKISNIKLAGDEDYFSEIESFFNKSNCKIEIKSKQVLPVSVIINIAEKKMSILRNEVVSIKQTSEAHASALPEKNKTSEYTNQSSNLESQNNNIDLNRKIKILIVDDSETIQKILSKLISSDPQMEVVKCISSPIEALEYIKKNPIDVITLDIHMPEMDGVTLLRNYIEHYPIPTVIVSSISLEDGPIVLSALEAGAIDYIQKPSLSEISSLGSVILDKIKSASTSKVKIQKIKNNNSSKKLKQTSNGEYSDAIVVIGSSTGGTEALKEVFMSFPSEIPPVLVVQHIPKHFSKAFADRLNELFDFTVKEAKDGDLIKKNQILIAPGGNQMKLLKFGSELKIEINDDPPVNRHSPSVDYFFYSVAELKLPKVIAVILTGMGADGAKGLLSLKLKEAETIAQNEETCVVFGMPKEAIKTGAANEILPLGEIAERIIELSRSKKIKTVA